ncbi:MAG TPA: NAD(P)-dependent oxidoreductase [Ktedonobacterales bacterium]|jgi:putative NADH-flavin reductase|nr:NAD(P)-dependent oxidoreductase [Ktedonobacterales bacterium]
MKIVLFGASGMIGQRIAREALSRGHEVTAVVRNPDQMTLTHERLAVVKGDALDAADVARVAASQDIVASAIGPSSDQPADQPSRAARALIEGTRRAGVGRLIVVGGGGSLEVAPGQALLDTPDFPPAWKPGAIAQRDALAVYRSEPAFDWTYLSPPAFIAPGERTGHYRVGGDQLVTDASGESRISAEDFAIAFVDEIEAPKYPRRRFTVAY